MERLHSNLITVFIPSPNEVPSIASIPTNENLEELTLKRERRKVGPVLGTFLLDKANT